MNPTTPGSESPTHDEGAYFAPTSPWTDALHQAWTPGEENGSGDGDFDGFDDGASSALTDAYNVH